MSYGSPWPQSGTRSRSRSLLSSSNDEELADLVPAGMLMAGHADFEAGAWCGATELLELGLAAQHELVEGAPRRREAGVGAAGQLWT